MKTKLALLFPVPRAVGMWELEQTAKSALKIIEPVKNKDTDVVPCFLERGLLTPIEHCYRYLAYRGEREIYEAAIQIEKDGYDALMLCCWLDPALLQIRQALNIPVVGAAQSSILCASIMGDKFSVITQNEIIIPQVMESVERSGLKSKLASIRPITLPDEEHIKALADAHDLFKDFQNIGRQCIADGAEVLLVGCMLMATILAAAPGCEKEFPNGLREVDGIPVVDNLSVLVKAAESIVTLKKAGLPWISRRLNFAQASKEIEERAMAAFKTEVPAYFTVQGKPDTQ